MAEKQTPPASADQVPPPRLAKADAPKKQEQAEIVAAARSNRPAVPVRKPLFGN